MLVPDDRPPRSARDNIGSAAFGGRRPAKCVARRVLAFMLLLASATCTVAGHAASAQIGDRNARFDGPGRGTAQTAEPRPVDPQRQDRTEKLTTWPTRASAGRAVLREDGVVVLVKWDGNVRLLAVPDLPQVERITESGEIYFATTKSGHLISWEFDCTPRAGDCVPSRAQRFHDLADVIDVHGGVYSWSALSKTGHAWLWGNDDCGQVTGRPVDCRHGSSSDRRIDVPRQLPLPKPLLQVRQGRRGNLDLDVDGDLWTWGSSRFHVDTGAEGELLKTKDGFEATRMSGVPKIAKLADDAEQECAIAVDETVWCWGRQYARWSPDGSPVLIGTREPRPMFGANGIVQIAGRRLLRRDGIVLERLDLTKDSLELDRSGDLPEGFVRGVGPDCYQGICALPRELGPEKLGALHGRVKSIGAFAVCEWISTGGECVASEWDLTGFADPNDKIYLP